MSLKDQITSDMKDAMRAHAAERLSTIRLLLAAIKQKEVDERIVADDAAIQQIIGKLIKQRRDSVEQYKAGGREDLATKEANEIEVLSVYLPKQMTDEEINSVIEETLSGSGLSGPAAMGKAMGLIKPKVAGKADMGKVSALIKAYLNR